MHGDIAPPRGRDPSQNSTPGLPGSSSHSGTEAGGTPSITSISPPEGPIQDREAIARRPAAASPAAAATVKRTRVLLSCHTCRASKLKCDRAVPCGQCRKKGRRASECEYAPRRERPRPAKNMAARLRRLEGMVRGLMDGEEAGAGAGAGVRARNGVALGAGRELEEAEEEEESLVDAGGRVVGGDRGTNYVGGTHFMALLEDIDELKNYFEYPDDDEVETDQGYYETTGSPDNLLLPSSKMPRNRDELLSLLPEKKVIDRLLIRYFNSNAPSQHILHKPTFNKEYSNFWQDPSSASLHWIAILFMVATLGVFFSSFQAPHELQGDSPLSAMDRIAIYRGAAGTALVWGKYSRPSQWTVQAFMLYVESDFMINRHSPMNCYLLSSVLLRLMLRMGLHRDPSKLPNVSPYDGEIRRRLWNLAIQLDLLVAFHLGLPSMVYGIESDTTLPVNLLDTDFDEDSTELPPARPSSDYTPLTYPIHKAALCRVFGQVARQAHSLVVPSYAEVTALDATLRATYAEVPPFMRVRPLGESVTDPPMQVVQRFGLASLYQKSRCVLHRRYLTDPPAAAANAALPLEGRPEHDYSRRQCLSAALDLLDYQVTIHEASGPGAMLGQNGWFLASIAINDFLLADMVVALVIQSRSYRDRGAGTGPGSGSGSGSGWGWSTPGDTPLPSKDELLRVLRRSLTVWKAAAERMPDCRKAAEVVETIVRRIDAQMGGGVSPGITSAAAFGTGAPGQIWQAEQAPIWSDVEPMAGLTIDSALGGSISASTAEQITPGLFGMSPPGMVDELGTGGAADAPWMGMPNGTEMDWRQFDGITRGEVDQPDFLVPDQTWLGQDVNTQTWLDRNPLDDLDFITSTSWNPTSPR